MPVFCTFSRAPDRSPRSHFRAKMVALPPGQRYIVQLLKAGHEAALEAPQSVMPVDAPQMESLPLPAKVGTAGQGGDGYDGYRLMVDTWGTEILPGMDWSEDEKRFSVCDRTFFISWMMALHATNILNCRSLNQSTLAPGAWGLFSEWWGRGQWGLWKWMNMR